MDTGKERRLEGDLDQAPVIIYSPLVEKDEEKGSYFLDYCSCSLSCVSANL